MPEMDHRDPYNLRRFVDAQGSVYSAVLSELRSGRKSSHWMWYIFPQLQGLGHSPMAEHYGISSLDEAKAYMHHPVLGSRLVECCRLVNIIQDSPIQEIFSYPDYLKFHSSITLFAHATTQNDPFKEAVDKFFSGKWDSLTLERL